MSGASSAMQEKKKLATWDFPAGHLCLYHEIEQYELLAQGVVPFPSITPNLVADGIQRRGISTFAP